MKHVACSVIIALGMVLAGFAIGGRYDYANIGSGSVARMDRFTGDVSWCVIVTEAPSCGVVLERARLPPGFEWDNP